MKQFWGARHREGTPGVVIGRLHGEFQPAHRAGILLRLHDEFQPGLNFEIEEKSKKNIKTCDLWKWASAFLAIEHIVTSNFRHFRMAVANKTLKQKPFL